MDPSRIEFILEDEYVTIVPRFRMSQVTLIDCELGPFLPNVSIDVPVWIAIQLKQQQKCRIIQPAWLSLDELQEAKEREESDSGCSLPPHPNYIEFANLLLQHAADDIEYPETVRTLIKDIWDLRSRKFIFSVHGFVSSDVASARVSQLTSMELSSIRGLLVNAVDQLNILRTVSAEVSATVPSLSSDMSTIDYSSSF